jgi:hypothetical protein
MASHGEEAACEPALNVDQEAASNRDQGSGALTEQGVVDAYLCCRTSCERHIPLFLQRPAGPPTWPKFELALANSMHEFQPSQSDGRRPIGLEAQHGAAPALDSPVILLDDIVQVMALTHEDVFPSVVLSTQSDCKW